jgi:hypothetical protein
MPHVVDTLENIRVPGPATEPLTLFQRMLRKIYEQLARVVNGQISFGDGVNEFSDNIDGVWANTTTPVGANTDFTIAHNLGRIPNGWLVVNQDANGVYFLGTVAPTTTEITLQCDKSSVTVRLFIF